MSKEDNMLKSHGRMKRWMAELEGKMDILHVKVKHMQDHPVPHSPTARAVRSIRAVSIASSSVAVGGGGGNGVTQSEKSSQSIGEASLGEWRKKYHVAALLFSIPDS